MLEEIKDEIDLESFFEAMGAKKLRKTSRGYSMRCIHPNHNDSGPSFHYKNNTQKFTCYGCGFNGDVIDIVQTIKNYKFKQALRWLKDFCGFSVVVTDKALLSIIEKREKQRGNTANTFSVVSEPAYLQMDFTKAGEKTRAYIEKRGWCVDTMTKLGVGFCEHGFFRDRIIFRAYDRTGTKLMTFAARATTIVLPHERYKYPLDSHLSVSMWPLHIPPVGPPVFVEGSPDAQRLREYGYDGYACLGNQLGEAKLDLIRKWFKKGEPIYVIPDADRGGEDLLKWFGQLVHEFQVMVGEMPVKRNPDGDRIKDVDELGLHFGRGPIDKIIKNACPFLELNNEKIKTPPSLVTELVNHVSSDHPFNFVPPFYRS